MSRTISSGKTRHSNTAGVAGPRGSRSSGQAPHSKHRRNRPGRLRRRILAWVLGVVGAMLAAGIGLFVYMWVTTEIPQPEKIAMAQKTEVYFADATTKIGTFADQNRQIISCSELPKYVPQAFVASENRTFYSDNGIDLKGIGRALLNNIRTGSRQGGSTITQQYAERYYLGQTTTYWGKLREAVLALKIAQTEDKNEVLCNYMNTIYLGRGAYGIQAAAQAYFNKDAKNLTLAEAGTLAGIIPSPTQWDPAKNPEQAQKRLTRVLSIMQEDGYITTAQEGESAAAPQTVQVQRQNTYAGTNGYLLQMVRSELVNTKVFTEDDLDTGGYKIITTIDKSKQDLMFQVGSPSLPANKIRPEGLQTGGISVNPKTGAIISLYAGDDYLTKQLNNVTQAVYEPGSTMKPFALLAAIQSGVSLNTYFNGNSPQEFSGLSKPVRNFGNASYGYIDLYHATANSVNTVFMALQEKLGTKKVAETAVAAGINGSLVKGDNPFTVLGNDGVHLSDMAQAYATIANQGNKPTLHIVASVKNAQAKDIYTAPGNAERVFDSKDVALLEKAMTGTVQYGTATEARKVGKTLAGKSGTANDNTAGSFVGFSPNTLTIFAMWLPDAQGNPQVIPSFGSYGNGSAYPIHLFTTYMTQALANTPNEEFPKATDSGKVGGLDGSWGTGARTRRRSQTPRTSEPTTSTPSPTTSSTAPAQGDQQQPQQGGDSGNSGNSGGNGNDDSSNSTDGNGDGGGGGDGGSETGQGTGEN